MTTKNVVKYCSKLIRCLGTYFSKERNWVFAKNSDFQLTISLEPNVADLRYFKLWILLNQIIWVWNIKGLQHRVLKILRFKYLILFQRLNSFTKCPNDQNWHCLTLSKNVLHWLINVVYNILYVSMYLSNCF